MKFKIIFYFLLFTFSLRAQTWGVWGVWNGAANAEAEDTTNDIYVSTAGSDLFNGLSISAAKRTIGGALDIAESGDSIFVLSGTYQEEDTIDVDNITLLAYDENNKPTILGGDTLSNFVWHEAVSADTTEKVYEQDLSSSLTTTTTVPVYYKITIDSAGTLKGDSIYIGSTLPTDSVAKTALYTLSGTTMHLVDSTTSEEVTVAANQLNWFPVLNGKYLTAGDYWTGYCADTDAPASIPFKNTATGPIFAAASTGAYNFWPYATQTVTVASRTPVGVGIVVQKITSGSGGNNYYAAASAAFEGLYFGNTKGNKVTALDSLSSSLDYHTANDSVYTLDTVNVIPIMRNGFIVKADNVNLNNMDFELTKTALRVDTVSNLNLEGIEIQKSNLGINSKNNGLVTFNRVGLYNNIEAIKDSSSSNLMIYNSIFAFSQLTNLQSDADTIKLINLTFGLNGKRNNIILNGATHIVFLNNSTYTGTGWVGEIDSIGAIDSMDYNGYGYYAAPDSCFWHIGTTSFGSLTSWQATSNFDNNSLSITSAGRNWTDFFNFDFSLTDTSQLINKGINYLTKDFANNDRDDTSDIGAYEFELQPPILTEFSASLLNDSTAQIAWFGDRIDSTTAYYGYSAASDSFAIVDTFSVTKKMQRYDGSIAIVAFNAANIAVDSANISGSIIFNHDIGDSTQIKIHYRVNGSSNWDSSNVTSYFKTYVNDTTYFKVRAKNSAGYGDYSNTAIVYPQVINFTKSITGLDSGTVYDYEISALNAVSNDYAKSSRKTFTTPAATPPAASTNIQIFVSNSLGNDANDGSINFPIKTLNELENRLTVYEDRDLTDTIEILLKKSDTWVESLQLKKIKGTSTYPVIVKSYGAGDKPVITLRQEVPGWSTATWTDAGDDVWYMSFALNKKLLRLWLDDTEVLRAVSLTGDNKDGTFGVNSTHKFFMDYFNSRLYVYSIANPKSEYSKIEFPGGVSSGSAISNTLVLQDADYIIIDGLDIQGGMYSAIGLGGADHCVIKNCNIGKYSNWAGIYGNSEGVSSSDKTSDYNEISNCTIDSDRKLIQKFYDGIAGVEYGIAVGNGAGWWDIHDNTIKDWSFGIFAVASSGYTLHHDIYNNDISNPDVGYGKVIQCIYYDQANLDSADTHINIYNNKFHDSPQGINICSSNNKIFFNLFYNITASQNEHATPGSSGYGVTMVQSGQSDFTFKNNYVFNNTFYNLNNYALQFVGQNSFIINNIFANCGLSAAGHYQAAASENTNETWKNNLFFYPGFGTNNQLVMIRNVDLFTVTEFNALDGEYNKTISGNVQDLDLPINTSSFKLDAESNAINASDTSAVFKNILKSVADSNGDFKDRLNNLILDNNEWFEVPNIGAVNDEQ